MKRTGARMLRLSRFGLTGIGLLGLGGRRDLEAGGAAEHGALAVAG